MTVGGKARHACLVFLSCWGGALQLEGMSSGDVPGTRCRVEDVSEGQHLVCKACKVCKACGGA
eukprot:1161643-Pelagomonas_calceolata.AAC.8